MEFDIYVQESEAMLPGDLQDWIDSLEDSESEGEGSEEVGSGGEGETELRPELMTL